MRQEGVRENAGSTHTFSEAPVFLASSRLVLVTRPPACLCCLSTNCFFLSSLDDWDRDAMVPILGGGYAVGFGRFEAYA